MTKTQSDIHLIICQHGEITLSALAELTGKSKTNLSNILARLKEQDKITRSDTATYKMVNEEPTKSEEVSAPSEGFNDDGEGFTASTGTRLLERIESENRFLRERVQFLEQALDQEQQLNAIGQRNVENLSNQIESQRLQLDEYQRPKPLMVRLKAVFVAE